MKKPAFRRIRADKQLEHYQRELLQTHFQEVDTMYHQMRGWRHDFRSHIQSMKAYAAEGDLEAIRRYLDALDTDLATVEPVIKTGNAMTDAILNSKISLARSKGITVQADAQIPYKLKISEVDLCVILGNLFDNAIDASMELPVRIFAKSVGPRNRNCFFLFSLYGLSESTPSRLTTVRSSCSNISLKLAKK